MLADKARGMSLAVRGCPGNGWPNVHMYPPVCPVQSKISKHGRGTHSRTMGTMRRLVSARREQYLSMLAPGVMNESTLSFSEPWI
jgi:hypothetical protein